MSNKGNVLVDSREPEWVVNGLGDYDKVSPAQKMLPVGDIVIDGRICIERKEINNLIGDIINNKSDRPWSQLRNMKDNFEENHIIVQGRRKDISIRNKKGINEELERDKKENMVTGTALSIVMDWGTNYWQVDDAIDFLDLVYRMTKKEKENSRSSKPYSAVKHSASMEERVIAILCQIPNIGSSRAKKIINNKSNVRAIANSSRNELQELLGNKTGDNVYKVFNEDIE